MPAGRPAIVERETVILSDIELLARLFRALGDATRLRILELLLETGDLHQMEIVRRLGLTQTRTSDHLACLVWCGFVEKRVEGRRTLYRVVNPQVPVLLSQARLFLEGNKAQVACCRRIDKTTEQGLD